MEHRIESKQDALQHNPYWIGVIFPFAIKDTFSRSDEDTSDPVEIDTKNILLLEDQILNWQNSSSKDSFTGVLQYILDPTVNVDTFNSEDWTLFWSFDNYEDYIYIKENLKKLINGEDSFGVLNEFKRAPKFVGQIQTIIKNENISGNGAISVNYTVTAHSFTPFAANQYFDPTLEQYTKNASTWWSNFSSFKYLTDNVQAGVIAAQKAIPSLLEITLGTGPDNLIFKEAGKRAVSPNTKFLIPKILVKIFTNANDLNNQDTTFLDILNSWIGIQKYNIGGGENEDLIGTFIPNNLNALPLPGSTKIYETENSIEGQMPLQPLNFTNQQTWSILDSYLNKPINEMYTCMKINREKRVVPTFIVRQNPLPLRSGFQEKTEEINDVIDTNLLNDAFARASVTPKYVTGKDPVYISPLKQAFQDAQIQNPVFKGLFQEKKSTYFDELPTWNIDLQYITNISVGKSGAARTNFISLTPFNGLKGESGRNELNASYSLPVLDSKDIQRNGLRSIMGSIPSAWVSDSDPDIVRRNGFANQLMASIMFNGHLKLSGQISMVGIQAPIQHGDNVSIDGITYHIERVMHSGGIQADGRKVFLTTLNVSHGVKLNSNGTHEYAKLSVLRHNVSKD